jgi:hypothetical protein
MNLLSGKHSRAKMAAHSGFWVGAPLADPKQANCKNSIVLQQNSDNLNHAKKAELQKTLEDINSSI